MEIDFSLPDEAATTRLGRRLARRLRGGDFIALAGPLGAGKTCLARAVVSELTGFAEAPSPTFSLVETYETPKFQLWHFDLYRLEKTKDIWELGFEDALDGGVTLVEWPDRIASLIPGGALLVRLSPDGAARRALVTGGEEWSSRLGGLNADEGLSER